MPSIIDRAIEWYLKKKKVKIEPEVTEVVFDNAIIELVAPYIDISLLRLRLSGSIKINVKSLTLTGIEEEEEES